MAVVVNSIQVWQTVCVLLVSIKGFDVPACSWQFIPLIQIVVIELLVVS